MRFYRNASNSTVLYCLEGSRPVDEEMVADEAAELEDVVLVDPPAALAEADPAPVMPPADPKRLSAFETELLAAWAEP